MKHITCYIDFISPYAYLAFEQLPKALEGLSYGVTYKPVLFAGLLKHHGQLGPAEIPAKRAWTYRHVKWLGRSLDIPIDLPAAHPFNPLGLLRLSLACGQAGACNRYVAETIFRHVWRGGLDAQDVQRLQALTRHLGPGRDPSSTQVKEELISNTDEAISRGVFGVPSFWVDERLIWGLDAMPMLRNVIENDTWFAGVSWQKCQELPLGTERKH